MQTPEIERAKATTEHAYEHPPATAQDRALKQQQHEQQMANLPRRIWCHACRKLSDVMLCHGTQMLPPGPTMAVEWRCTACGAVLSGPQLIPMGQQGPPTSAGGIVVPGGLALS